MWRRFLSTEAGNMAILFAAGMGIASVIAAFAVDAAALYHEKRMLQAAVDLAAISAARDPADAQARAYRALLDADVLPADTTLAMLADPDGDSQLVVERGHYAPDPALAPATRFVVNAEPINAVRVRARKPGRLYFASTWSPLPVIGASAVATATPRVAFSVGSRVARLRGGIANALLDRLLGTSISLTVADYNALADADVELLAFMEALAGELGITAGTYADVLAATASHGEIAAALGHLLDGAAGTAAGLIAGVAGSADVVPVGRLIDLGDMAGLAIGSGGQNLFTSISALDVLAASAALGEGSRQVDLGLTAGLPGLAGIDVDLVIGEPPQEGAWFAVGPVGTVARTAQVRLRITARMLGGTTLLGAGVTLPLYLDIAHAEAMVSAATCPTPEQPHGSATILTRPGLVRLAVGAVDETSLADFGTAPAVEPTPLVDVLLLEITGSAYAEIAADEAMPLAFSSGDIGAGTIKTAAISELLTPLVGSLLDELELEIDILGLGLSTEAALRGALTALLAPVAPLLDAIVMRALDALGLSIGEADVRVYGVTCSHPVLVG
jgi:uncharacterized membrane protein